MIRSMSSAVVFTTVLVALISSVVSSAVLLLLGGYGGYLKTTQTLKQHADELDRLETKIIREVKQRAALGGAKKNEYQDLLDQIEKNPQFSTDGVNDLKARRSAIRERAKKHA